MLRGRLLIKEAVVDAQTLNESSAIHFAAQSSIVSLGTAFKENDDGR
jgi:hypothetical protein